MADTGAQVAPAAVTQREFVMPTEACYHCWRLPDLDGDHTCPCPKRDGECPEHDPITTFAEYQRRYQPNEYQRARLDALTPEQASRYTLRRALQQISDDIFREQMARAHADLHPVNLAFGGDGCRSGWSNCPTFLASLTEGQRKQIEDASDPERWQ